MIIWEGFILVLLDVCVEGRWACAVFVSERDFFSLALQHWVHIAPGISSSLQSM